jgi:hypothetical protein
MVSLFVRSKNWRERVPHDSMREAGGRPYLMHSLELRPEECLQHSRSRTLKPGRKCRYTEAGGACCIGRLRALHHRLQGLDHQNRRCIESRILALFGSVSHSVKFRLYSVPPRSLSLGDEIWAVTRQKSQLTRSIVWVTAEKKGAASQTDGRLLRISESPTQSKLITTSLVLLFPPRSAYLHLQQLPSLLSMTAFLYLSTVSECVG